MFGGRCNKAYSYIKHTHTHTRAYKPRPHTIFHAHTEHIIIIHGTLFYIEWLCIESILTMECCWREKSGHPKNTEKISLNLFQRKHRTFIRGRKERYTNFHSPIERERNVHFRPCSNKHIFYLNTNIANRESFSEPFYILHIFDFLCIKFEYTPFHLVNNV